MWHLQAIQELNSLAHACTLAGIPEKSALKVMVDPRYSKEKSFLHKINKINPTINGIIYLDKILASLEEKPELWNN